VSWEKCIEMWEYIVAHIHSNPKEANTKVELALSCIVIEELKRRWCKEHGFTDMDSNCFFCEYSKQQHKISTACVGRCTFCPAKRVDSDFDCQSYEYAYLYKPEEFLAKIKELYKIYKERK
jgi:hypothetical protein